MRSRRSEKRKIKFHIYFYTYFISTSGTKNLPLIWQSSCSCSIISCHKTYLWNSSGLLIFFAVTFNRHKTLAGRRRRPKTIGQLRLLCQTRGKSTCAHYVRHIIRIIEVSRNMTRKPWLSGMRGGGECDFTTRGGVIRWKRWEVLRRQSTLSLMTSQTPWVRHRVLQLPRVKSYREWKMKWMKKLIKE